VVLKESIFLSGYNDINLQICKETKFLGWMQNSKRKVLSEGDYVFIYNINTKMIESLFRIVSKSDNTELIWKDEKESNQIRYKNRWTANLISDKLNIDRDELLKYFGNVLNRFNLLIRNPFPNFLDDKYDDLRSFLLTKIPTEVSLSGQTHTNDILENKLNAKQYFLIQVNEFGSKNLLENSKYEHSGWTETPRDSDHGKVKEGDILLIYFARNSVQYKQSMKKIFVVNSVTGDSTTFNVKELKDLQGISLQEIKSAIEQGKISDSFNKLGQQGFNIKQISESDYNAILSLDNNLYPSSIGETQLNKRDWLSLSDAEIQEIIDKVLVANGKRLEIDPLVIKRIISHLMLSKHVILVGPPGTGKTDLAMRLLRELGTRLLGKTDPVEAVASYEWGRYEVIGGASIAGNGTENPFHLGCVTNAILQQKLLLIDEFNRADMNKAFGEMFLAIDHGNIILREDEKPNGFALQPGNKISIPSDFRMICTMNDYDKSLLNDLSYGLLRRFAFVEIGIPGDKQKIKTVVIERVRRDLHTLGDQQLNNGLSIIDKQIENLIDFMLSIKQKRQIGLSSYIDIIRYILFEVIVTKNAPWQVMNDALIDYLLPQFDRLDIDTLRVVSNACSILYDGSDKIAGIKVEIFSTRLSEMIGKLEEVSQLFDNK